MPNFLKNSRPRSFSAGNSLYSRGALDQGRLVDKTKSVDDGKKKLGPSNPSRYKTELCRPYQEYGHCKYADKCQFAHGGHELRALPRHPKYKTDLCRTFHTKGFCPYGPRCHFVHSLEEVRRPPPIITRTSSATTIPHYPPLSPSQDSGISSPDDTGNYFSSGNGKVFDFAISDSSSEEIDIETDGPSWRKTTAPPSSEWNGITWKTASPTHPSQSVDLFADLDSVSSGSLSPTKSVTGHCASSGTNLDYDLTERLSCVSLDDSMASSHSHSRLPVFDDMVNSGSDTILDRRWL